MCLAFARLSLDQVEVLTDQPEMAVLAAAARASFTFSVASRMESPSVINSGNNGDVTV